MNRTVKGRIGCVLHSTILFGTDLFISVSDSALAQSISQVWESFRGMAGPSPERAVDLCG